MPGKILGEPEPYHDLDRPIRTQGDVFDLRLKRWSNQDQVDEREHSGADPDCDQGVVDPDVGIERRWESLLAHGEDLRRSAAGFCELDHMGWGFLRRRMDSLRKRERPGDLRVAS